MLSENSLATGSICEIGNESLGDLVNVQLSMASRIAREQEMARERLAAKRDAAVDRWWQSDLWCARYHRAITDKMEDRDSVNAWGIQLSKPCEFYFARMKRHANVVKQTHLPVRSTDVNSYLAESKLRRRGAVTFGGDAYLYLTDEHYAR